LRPVHTPFDGDTVFALSTATARPPVAPDLLACIGMLAADALARACARAVYEAASLGDQPGYRQHYRRFFS
ncbi:MAG: P1 family peptidase, partial [Candidatus Competibacterales bacterium]|nr:P1 family peptidase [Candidatus Competibacterales bacterium]